MSDLEAETQVVRDFYAALNRNDIPAITAAFAPQIEWTDPADAGGGTWQGFAAVTKHFAEARGNWAEGTREPERFITAGDNVVVFAHVHVRVEGETEWREGDLVDVFTFRNGMIEQGRSFSDRQEALEWAGAEAADIS
ncbi:MAG: nuclear transport factor 2 family protein [Chloroflexi bacterium]|nr:MAG: nuclear transport factor 2 family protein [Chloroflexota bacterium]